MKKHILLFGAIFSLFFISCEGPAGPPGLNGFDGEDGQDAEPFEAAAWEIDVDLAFNSDTGNFEYRELYPSDVTLLDGDAVLIYRLEEVTDDGLDVWRQLPQPVLTDDGYVFYNFDFTLDDYSIYAEPEFDGALVSTNLTQNQIFRVVVVPTDFYRTSKIDETNLSSLLSGLGIEESAIQKLH